MQNGDFSNLRNASGAVIPVYDPLTTCGQLGNPACGSQPLRTPFPENKLPPERLDTAAKWTRNLWALPNVPGIQYTNVNNYISNGSVGGQSNQINARVDRDISSRQRMFARYTRWANSNLGIDPFGTGMYIDRPDEGTKTHQAVFADTYTISSSTVLDVRAAVLRFMYDRAPKTMGFDLTKLGWPAFMNNQVTWRTYPTASVSGYSDLFTSPGTGAIIINAAPAIPLPRR